MGIGITKVSSSGNELDLPFNTMEMPEMIPIRSKGDENKTAIQVPLLAKLLWSGNLPVTGRACMESLWFMRQP